MEFFGLKAAYNADKDPNKVDLGIGAYRTNDGKPYVLKVVRKAEKAIVSDESLNKEYLNMRAWAHLRPRPQSYCTENPVKL